MMHLKVPGNRRVLGVKDVSAELFIAKAAAVLKDSTEFEVPDWAELIKTGASRQRAPDSPDFFYVRAASLLRKISIKGRSGVGLLKREYGISKNNGVAPCHTSLASGKVIRHCLQQLQKLGYLELDKNNKRHLTSKGQAAVDQIARRC